jgi:hypothetical protein
VLAEPPTPRHYDQLSVVSTYVDVDLLAGKE